MKSPRIYISYRSQDTSTKIAQNLYSLMLANFGYENILRSSDYEDATPQDIQQAVNSCDVIILLIGRYWFDMVDRSGAQLLADPYDPTHVEIDAALRDNHNLLKIWALNLDTPFSKSQLPQSLRELGNHKVTEVNSPANFEVASTELIRFLQETPVSRLYKLRPKPTISQRLIPTTTYAQRLGSKKRIQFERWLNATSFVEKFDLFLRFAIICAALIFGLMVLALIASQDQPAVPQEQPYYNVAFHGISAQYPEDWTLGSLKDQITLEQGDTRITLIPPTQLPQGTGVTERINILQQDYLKSPEPKASGELRKLPVSIWFASIQEFSTGDLIAIVPLTSEESVGIIVQTPSTEELAQLMPMLLKLIRSIEKI